MILANITRNLRGSLQLLIAAAAGTTTILPGVQLLVTRHTSTIASHTFVFPATPVDFQRIRIATRAAITAVTITSAKTVNGGVTTLAADSFAEWIYLFAGDQWYRIG
jgi:hypothetical protein